MIRKYVITAGSSCGKTSLIKFLEELGNPVMHEIAREVIQKRIRGNDNLKDVLSMQREIFYRQLAREEELEYEMKDKKRVFLDRGVNDVIAYCKLRLGEIPEEFITPVLKDRYDVVFLLDKLPFKKDEVRIERDEREAGRAHEEIRKSYEDHGYNLIRIPVFNKKTKIEAISARAIEILQKIYQLEAENRRWCA